MFMATSSSSRVLHSAFAASSHGSKTTLPATETPSIRIKKHIGLIDVDGTALVSREFGAAETLNFEIPKAMKYFSEAWSNYLCTNMDAGSPQHTIDQLKDRKDKENILTRESVRKLFTKYFPHQKNVPVIIPTDARKDSHPGETYATHVQPLYESIENFKQQHKDNLTAATCQKFSDNEYKMKAEKEIERLHKYEEEIAVREFESEFDASKLFSKEEEKNANIKTQVREWLLKTVFNNTFCEDMGRSYRKALGKEAYSGIKKDEEFNTSQIKKLTAELTWKLSTEQKLGLNDDQCAFIASSISMFRSHYRDYLTQKGLMAQYIIDLLKKEALSFVFFDDKPLFRGNFIRANRGGINGIVSLTAVAVDERKISEETYKKELEKHFCQVYLREYKDLCKTVTPLLKKGELTPTFNRIDSLFLNEEALNKNLNSFEQLRRYTQNQLAANNDQHVLFLLFNQMMLDPHTTVRSLSVLLQLLSLTSQLLKEPTRINISEYKKLAAEIVDSSVLHLVSDTKDSNQAIIHGPWARVINEAVKAACAIEYARMPVSSLSNSSMSSRQLGNNAVAAAASDVNYHVPTASAALR